MYAEMKGSLLEERIKGQAQAELTGAGMYFSLARAAKEHNLLEVADSFKELALEHAAQASYYASLVGRYPYEETELWQFIKGLSKAEEFGDVMISELAAQVKESGFAEAAEVVKSFAAQHKHHAEVTAQLLEKYAPKSVKDKANKRYVCSVCGFVYEGELENEPENYTCPLCSMPKEVFALEG